MVLLEEGLALELEAVDERVDVVLFADDDETVENLELEDLETRAGEVGVAVTEEAMVVVAPFDVGEGE